MLTLLLSAQSNAFATSYSNTKTTSRINGHYYKYKSGIDKYASTVQARGYTEEKAGNSMPAGTFGGKASLYNSNGNLAKSGAWDYNDRRAVAIDFAGATTSLSGTYYSIAYFKYYNGSGYSTTYKGYNSPNQRITYNLLNEKEDYADFERVCKTKDGLTYGSGLCILSGKEEPDLIAATGEMGVEGYVFASDLDDGVTSLEEALRNSVPEGSSVIQYIPLYDLDMNIIGQFKIETNGAKEFVK